MAAVVPVKTVSFKLPEGGPSSGSRTETPEQVNSTNLRHGQRPLGSALKAGREGAGSPAIRGPSTTSSCSNTTDGVALLHQIKACGKLSQQIRVYPTTSSPPPHSSSPITLGGSLNLATKNSTSNSPLSEQPQAMDTQSGVRGGSPVEGGRPKSRPGSDVQEVLRQQRAKSGKAGRYGSGFVASRDRSPLLFDRHDRMSASQVAQVASQVRERTNSTSHDHIRSLKYEVARLREHLLKIEEEVKHLSRGRRTLELAVEEVRKAISVNQQSHSSQLKKSRGDADGSLKLLHEESQVLSKSKRSMEHHMQTVKTHLQTLDSTRKTLQTKIGSLSQALELDAQNFKLFDGPVAVRRDSISRQRQYASGCPQPRTRSGNDSAAASQLCSKAVEAISASRSVRAEIKPLIVSVHTRKAEAHEKITGAIARNMQEARAQRQDILLERGQIRLAQNSTNHQKHSEEIALGIALGPISEKHRSVSEKHDRPMSRVRPASAMEERASSKRTTSKLTRQLSATTLRASAMSETDKRLARCLKDRSHSATLDSQTLRIRKISLDNRWVQ